LSHYGKVAVVVASIIAIALVVVMMLGIMLWGVFTERRR
jgi:hypothetical protein